MVDFATSLVFVIYDASENSPETSFRPLED